MSEDTAARGKAKTPIPLHTPGIVLRSASPPACAICACRAAGGPAQAGLKDYLLNPDDPIQEVSVVLGSEDSKFIFNPRCGERGGGVLYLCAVCGVASAIARFKAQG